MAESQPGLLRTVSRTVSRSAQLIDAIVGVRQEEVPGIDAIRREEAPGIDDPVQDNGLSREGSRGGERIDSTPRRLATAPSMDLATASTLNPREQEELEIKQMVREKFGCDEDDVQEYYVNPQATHKFENGGKMGIDCDANGIVREVISNTPAEKKGIRQGDKILKVGKEKFSMKSLSGAEEKSSAYFVTVWHTPLFDASKYVDRRVTLDDGYRYETLTDAPVLCQLQLQSRVFGTLPNAQNHILLGAFKTGGDDAVYVDCDAYMHADKLVRVQRRYYIVSSKDLFDKSYQEGTIIAATLNSHQIRIHARSRRVGGEAVWERVEQTFALDDTSVEKLNKLCTRMLNEDCPINFSFQKADNIMVYQLPVDLYNSTLGRKFLPEAMSKNLAKPGKIPRGFYLWLKDGRIEEPPTDRQQFLETIQGLCRRWRSDEDTRGEKAPIEFTEDWEEKLQRAGLRLSPDGDKELLCYDKGNNKIRVKQFTNSDGLRFKLHDTPHQDQFPLLLKVREYDLYVKVDSQKEFINTTFFFLVSASIKIFSEFNSIGVMFSVNYTNWVAYAFLFQFLLNVVSSGITSCRLAASLMREGSVFREELQLDRENACSKGIYMVKLALLMFLRAPQLWVQTLMHVHPRAVAQGRFAGKFNGVRIFGTTWLRYSHYCSENNSFYLPTIPGQVLNEIVSLALAWAILKRQQSRFIKFAYVFKLWLFFLRLFRYYQWVREKVLFHAQALQAWKNLNEQSTPPVPKRIPDEWSDSKKNLARMLQKNFDRAPKGQLEKWRWRDEFGSTRAEVRSADWFAKWFVRGLNCIQFVLLFEQLWFYDPFDFMRRRDPATTHFTKFGNGSCTKGGSIYGELISNTESSHADCMSLCAASSRCVAFTDGDPNGPLSGFCKLHSDYPDGVGDAIFQCWVNEASLNHTLGPSVWTDRQTRSAALTRSQAFSFETDDRGLGSSPAVVPASSVPMASAASNALVSAAPSKASGKGLKLAILQLLNDAIDVEGLSLIQEMGVSNVQHLFEEGNEDLMGDVIAKLVKKEALQRKESIAV